MSTTHLPTCPYCGAVGTIKAHARKVRGGSHRRKFGIGWLLATIMTAGVALFLYPLLAPKRADVVGVDRWTECRACGATW